MHESLVDLLAYHREDLLQLKANLVTMALPYIPDDIWLIRFLIRSNVEKASKRVAAMLAWRAKHNADGVAERIVKENLTQKDFPYFDIFESVYPQRTLVGISLKGSPCSAEYMPKMDMQAIVKKLSYEQFFMFNLYRMEYIRLVLDAITRSTGMLSRYVFILDVQFSMRQFSPSFMPYIAVSYGCLVRRFIFSVGVGMVGMGVMF